MKRVLVAIVFFLAILPKAVYSEEWQNKISFEMPSSWRLLNSKSTSSVVAKLYYIRDDIVNAEKLNSNALLQYYPVPTNVTIADADGIVASRLKGAARILSAEDSPFWRTYLFLNHEKNQPYAVLYRIGIADGVCFEFLLSFPIIKRTTDSSLSMMILNEKYVKEPQMAGIYCHRSAVKDMVAFFNTVCTKIKISNRNQYNADVKIVDPPADAQVYRYVGEGKKKE